MVQCAVIGKCRVPADMPLGEVLDALRQTRRGKFEIYERIFSRGSWLKDVLLLVNDPDPYVASLYRTRVRSTVSAARLIGEWSGGNQPRTRNLTRLTSTVRWRERAHAICSRLGAFSSLRRCSGCATPREPSATRYRPGVLLQAPGARLWTSQRGSELVRIPKAGRRDREAGALKKRRHPLVNENNLLFGEATTGSRLFHEAGILGKRENSTKAHAHHSRAPFPPDTVV